VPEQGASYASATFLVDDRLIRRNHVGGPASALKRGEPRVRVAALLRLVLQLRTQQDELLAGR
jgi:hypothetical protein